MSQTKKASFGEAVVNTAIGLVIAWVAQWLICWVYSIPLNGYDNLRIVFWMTVLSVVRQYVVRRFFNRMSKRIDEFGEYVEEGIRQG